MFKSHIFTFLVFILFPFFAQSQVGIGTVTPNAQLEISASNPAAPSNIDGLLIPKIDEFPVTNPTIAQDGMMVFVTGSGSATRGYYYWHQATTSWQNLSSGAEQVNDLSDGRSDNDGTNYGSSVFIGVGSGFDDDLTDNRNVGLGYWALLNSDTGSRNVAVGHSSMVLNTSGMLNTAFGSSSLRNNNIGNANTAIGTGALSSTNADNNTGVGYETLGQNSSGTYNASLGYRAGYRNNGSNNVFLGARAGEGPASNTISGSVFIGYHAGINENTSNKLYIHNSGITTPLIYGEFDTNLLRINGTLNINNAYSLPTADGTASQLLQTDGAGNLSWVNTNSFGVQRINDLIDGRSDNDGSEDGSSIYLGISAGLNDDSSDNKNTGIGYQVLSLNSAGTNNTAVGYQALTTNTIGMHNSAFGIQALASAISSSSNSAFGAWSLTSNTIGIANSAFGVSSLGANLSGERNTAIGFHSLALNQHGSHNIALGFQSGYNNLGSTNTFLGYMSGRGVSSYTSTGNVFIGYQSGYFETGNNKLIIENSSSTLPLIYGEFDNDLLRINGTLNVNNAYSLPTSDGAASQLLQTDGAGNLSWVNSSALGDDDWTDVGGDIERQTGNVYIGDNATTGNDLYVNDRIIDWDDTTYYLDPDNINRMDEVSLDRGSASDPSVTFGDARTGLFSPAANIVAVTNNNIESVRIDASGNVGVGTTAPAYKLEVSGAIMLEDSGAPAPTAGHSGFYSRSGELYAIDSAGNATIISPHHFELTEASDPMAWSFYSKNESVGQQINVDMLKLAKTVESLSGQELVFRADLEGNAIKSANKTKSLEEKVRDQQKEIYALKAQIKAIKALLQQKD